MQVVQIDHVDSEALQGEIATVASIFRGTIDSPFCSRRGTGHDSELSCENDAITPTLESLADFYLGVAINVRGIEKINTQVKSTMDKADGIGFVLRTAGVYIIDTNAHATKSNCGDFGAA